MTNLTNYVIVITTNGCPVDVGSISSSDAVCAFFNGFDASFSLALALAVTIVITRALRPPRFPQE